MRRDTVREDEHIQAKAIQEMWQSTVLGSVLLFEDPLPCEFETPFTLDTDLVSSPDEPAFTSSIVT